MVALALLYAYLRSCTPSPVPHACDSNTRTRLHGLCAGSDSGTGFLRPLKMLRYQGAALKGKGTSLSNRKVRAQTVITRASYNKDGAWWKQLVAAGASAAVRIQNPGSRTAAAPELITMPLL